MKSIRKDDVKTTATELGIKVGDKFVILSPDESYKNTPYQSDYCVIGDVLTLWYDDNTPSPKFQNERTREIFYENFDCLARYEDVNEVQVVGKAKLEVVEASFVPNYDKDDGTMLCKLEVGNITFEQYQKLLAFINTL